MVEATPTLVGARVVLRAPHASDVQARQALGWHHEIERGYGSDRTDGPATIEEAREWFDYVSEGLSAGTSWVIEVDGQLAGIANLHHISVQDRNAMFAIGMLAADFMGRGLGAESTRLVLSHAFRTMGLHRVWLRVLSDNARAIRSYESCGFVYEGTQRESCLRNGTWIHDHFYGILDGEFLASQAAQ